MLAQESVLTGCKRPVRKGEVEVSFSGSRIPVSNIPAWKRGLDLVLIVLSLPLWMPVMIAIAVGIKLVSWKGPVLFRQERIGYGGKKFLCLKFRSMRCDADIQLHKEHLRQLMESGAPMIKLDRDNDPRLIPFGGIFRASGLDELPQVFNVLRGEMSLVGPRPCTPYEYERYQPWQKERFAALPGLTGLWQVAGKNHTSFDQMVRLDIKYAERLSIWDDIRILARTPGVVLGQLTDTRHNTNKTA